jgi:hypothetical protein
MSKAATGLYAAFAIAAPSARDEPPMRDLSINELIDRAIENADEHAIKFTEVLHPRARAESAARLPVAFQMKDMCNIRRLMWANDFPQSDSTWP